MSITTVNNQLQTILQTVSGIGTVYAVPPPILDTAKLPAAWILTGAGSDTLYVDDMLEESRTYRIQVAVVAKGQANPEIRESRGRAFIDAVKDKLRGYTTLNGLAYIQGCKVSGDSGIVVLPDYGAKYIGFEVRLEVTEIAPIIHYD